MTKEETSQAYDINKYALKFYNDDETPFNFVLSILYNACDATKEEAFDLTNKIQENGWGLYGSYIKEIADQKKTLIQINAKNSNYPLKVELVGLNNES